MIGRNLSQLYRWPRRAILAIFGIPDIMVRYKWRILWRELKTIPQDRRVRMLDAGCGAGSWSLEIARRRPNWEIVGIDLSGDGIRTAEKNAKILGVKNCSFEQVDFLNYTGDPERKFDLVLSVSSFHYLLENGMGSELTRRVSEWVRPGGILLFMGPRRSEETHFRKAFKKDKWHSVFSRKELEDITANSGFSIVKLRPEMFLFATWIKENRELFVDKKLLFKALFPLNFLLYLLDPLNKSRKLSMMWILMAKKD